MLKTLLDLKIEGNFSKLIKIWVFFSKVMQSVWTKIIKRKTNVSLYKEWLTSLTEDLK